MKYKYREYISLIVIGVIFFITIIFSGALQNAIDFVPLYHSSRLISQGENIYNFDLLRKLILNDSNADTAIHYLYPPFLAVIIQPITSLALPQALVIWLLINSVAVVIAIAILLKKYLKTSFLTFLLGLLILYLYLPILQNLQLGQVNPLVFLFLSLGLILLINNKNYLAGITLGLASLIKIFPVVFLAYSLIMKKWKIFFSGIFTIIIGCLLAAILIGQGGFDIHWHYLTKVLPAIFSGNLPGWNPGTLMSGVLDLLWKMPQYSALIKISSKVILIIFFLFIGYKYLIKKQKADKEIVSLEYSFLMAMMVISSAFSFQHYLIWLIIPLVVLYNHYLKEKNRKTLVGIIIIFCLGAFPTIFLEYIIPHNMNAYIYPLINPGFWAVVITLGMLTYLILKKGENKQL